MGVGLFTDIFQFLVGKDFREGLGVVPILLLANLFYGIFFNVSIWYKLTNKTWYGVYYTFSGALITLILYFTLIPVIGYYGAAIARLVCYIFMTVICIVGGQKHYPIPYDFKRIALYIVSAIVLFIIGYYFTIPNKLLAYTFRIFLISGFLLVVFFTEKFSFKQILQFIKHDS